MLVHLLLEFNRRKQNETLKRKYKTVGASLLTPHFPLHVNEKSGVEVSETVVQTQESQNAVQPHDAVVLSYSSFSAQSVGDLRNDGA